MRLKLESMDETDWFSQCLVALTQTPLQGSWKPRSLYQYFRTIKRPDDVNRARRRLPVTRHASSTAIFSYLGADERMAAQNDRVGPPTYLNLYRSSALVDVQASRRCILRPCLWMGRIAGPDFVTTVNDSIGAPILGDIVSLDSFICWYKFLK